MFSDFDVNNPERVFKEWFSVNKLVMQGEVNKKSSKNEGVMIKLNTLTGILEIAEWLNGDMEGSCLTILSSGTREIIQYKKGIKHGEKKTISLDGIVQTETYEKGKKKNKQKQ